MGAVEGAAPHADGPLWGGIVSEHPYPPDEHCEATDWFSTSLPRRLFVLRGELIETERRAHDAEMVAVRYVEGIMCLQWELSKLMKRGKVLVKPDRLERHLQELVVFAHVGTVPTWIRTARKEPGRDR